MRIRHVTYNNKSRKGKYIGIKEAGKRERIIKDYPELTQEFYKYAYENNLNTWDLRKASKALVGMKNAKRRQHGKMLRGSTGVETTLEELRDYVSQSRSLLL